MCDAGIDLEKVEAMRQAYAELRAAALRVLDSGSGPEALAALRVACEVDPAGFAFAVEPMHRIVVRRLGTPSPSSA